MNNDITFSLIMAVVDRGFASPVMAAARDAGARGGTIINARGTGNLDIEKFFGFIIEPEKEIILILTTKELRHEIMKAIYKTGGLTTEGHGFAIALPVEEVAGIFKLTNDYKENGDGKPGADE
ncbi:MAG: P-II family nitrogen regulator [Clostridiales bacterium]|jgi:hypothetical protein|nr:P-II family nitrogen regulator [Clostridiales bacterium]